MNILEDLKRILDARDVVEHFLGEPAVIKSGETCKWRSPFREGDNDPSLCANKDTISDFGSDKREHRGMDIFNFVMELKGISLQGAVELIAKDFNIELPNHSNFTTFTNFTQNNNSNNSNSVKKIYTLKATDEKVEEIYCMFDTVAYTSKPLEEIGKIKNRIPHLQPLVYTLDGLKAEIVSGKTCMPARNKKSDGLAR